MRLMSLVERKIQKDEFEDMTLADSLEIVIDLLDAGDLSEREQDIVADMLDKLDNVEDIPDSEYEDEDADEMMEAKTIAQHSNTAEKRMATFEKTPAGERIKNRIKQRRYRRKPQVKTRARRRAARQSTCGKNQTAQLSKKGGSSYVCKIKDRLKSKLMKRVARIYG